MTDHAITVGQRECQLEGEEVNNILLRTTFDDRIDDEICTDLLTVEEPSRENILSITLTQSPDDRLETWNHHVETMPSETVIITVGDKLRSANSQPTNNIGQKDSGQLTVESISDLSNLTQLGVRITDALKQWNHSSNRIVICFHSLTALLKYHELDVVFQFLDTLTSHVRFEDALAHYHLDPNAHNQQAYSTIRLLFDVIIKADNGDITITER